MVGINDAHCQMTDEIIHQMSTQQLTAPKRKWHPQTDTAVYVRSGICVICDMCATANYFSCTLCNCVCLPRACLRIENIGQNGQPTNRCDVNGETFEQWHVLYHIPNFQIVPTN